MWELEEQPRHFTSAREFDLWLAIPVGALVSVFWNKENY
jgi:hypothetical protein